MSPLRDQKTQSGLVTDPPGDRIGDGALRIGNMLPAGPDNVKPRPGVSLVVNFEHGALGRLVMADAAINNLGRGVLIATVNGTGDDLISGGGESNHEVTHLGRFAPAVVADEYAAVAGFGLLNKAYGLVF